MSKTRRRPVVEPLESRDVPALLFGVTTQNHLISFDSATPGTLISDVAISGIGGSEQVLTLDFSPHTNELVALARNGTNFGIYIINPATGAATPRSPNPFPAINLPQGDIGTDFDPVTGHLRLVSSTEDQSRVAIDDIPLSTSTAAITILTDLAYATGDANQGVNPNVVALAHRNNIAGSTVNNVFALDSGTNSVVRIGSANGNPDSPDTGKLFTINPVRVNSQVVDFSAVAGFDAADGATATAFVSLVIGSNTRSKLHTLSTTSGNATELGDIGTAANVFVRDIAVALVGGIRFAATDLTVSEGAGVANLTLTRTLPSLVPTTLTVSVSGVTATPGGDFTLGTATVTFNPGETSKTVVINLVNDGAVEGTETLRVSLTGATNNASIFNPNQATLTVVDDDVPPPPPPPQPPAGVVARVIKVRRRFRVVANDAATGELKAVLGTFALRPRVLHLDLNGDGVLDVLIKFTLNSRKKQRRFDGVTLARI